MNTQITNDQATDSKWKSLYKAGGVGALIVGTLLLIEMIAYITTSAPRSGRCSRLVQPVS